MLHNDGIKIFFLSLNLSLHHNGDFPLIYVPNFDYLNLDNFSPPLAEVSLLLKLTILSREIYIHASISFILRNDIAYFTAQYIASFLVYIFMILIRCTKMMEFSYWQHKRIRIIFNV